MQLLLEYAPKVLSGVWLTIGLSLTGLVISVVLGATLAVFNLSKNAMLNTVAQSYITLVRGIPDLVLMLLIYFGGQSLLNQLGAASGLWGYVEINSFAAGSLTLGLIFGAYMAETFRGAFLSIPTGQVEAAKVLGLRPHVYLPKIILPQLIPLALPSFSNNWLVLLKTTALVSILGLQDIVYNANQAGRTSQQPFMFLLLAFFVYLFLTLVSDFGLRHLCRRLLLKNGNARMELALIFDNWPLFAKGIWNTISLVAISLVAGFFLALPLALCQAYRVPVLGKLATGYSYVVRGTPLLIQAYLIYYGLAQFDFIRSSMAWVVLKDAYFCA